MQESWDFHCGRVCWWLKFALRWSLQLWLKVPCMGLGLFCSSWIYSLFSRNFVLRSRVPVGRRTAPFDLLCTSASELAGGFCRSLCSVHELCLQNISSFLCPLFKDGIWWSVILVKYGQFLVRAEEVFCSRGWSQWCVSPVLLLRLEAVCPVEIQDSACLSRIAAGKPYYPPLHFSLWYCM